MRTIILKISIVSLLLSLMGAGCDKEEDISQSILNGKWILVGFGDDSTNEFIPEPESEPQSSYLVFEDGELVAFSVTNKTYDISYKVEGKIIKVIDKGGRTKVGGDTEWGLKFLIAISDIYKFNINSELILYYEGQKFMKLKKEIK